VETKPAGTKPAKVIEQMMEFDDPAEGEKPAAEAGEDAGKTKEGDDAAKSGDNAGQYEFKVPDGMALDEGLVAKFTPLARELELSPEQAQKFADIYAEHVSATTTKMQEVQQQEYEAQQEAWAGEIKADPEYGGDHLTQTKRLAGIGVMRGLGQEVRDVLEMTGLVNHPAVVRACAKLGKLFSERPLEKGGTVQPQEPDPRALRYPTMATNK
jgi:hypothetical protein